jgi:AGZA family xanthine/uracil permease-like MFS transporter
MFVGISLFLTLIGLMYSEGIGLIVGATSISTELAGCINSVYNLDTGLCLGSKKMRLGIMWIGIFCGGILMSLLLIYRVKGAILYGIILVSIISWLHNTLVIYFLYIDVGNDNFDFFKKVVDFYEISRVLNV